ncbi:CHC2 zinc finger domain-containing protein [Pedococcus sp. 5OH_020]|uniref:CHC2 zinc finger domain-containing protein n=1 Tax=Pedococcus sp. 5OH_020 TaxID=2989814 RepID=UPI0022E9B293|nr:CHC2 zinc finger domain-containing protein [Pedococcus sp. 5OH_020]
MTTTAGAVNVERVRADHPIEQVIVAAGIQLTPRGHGFIGCCPFHADATPSMSVGGVPDRFHCFGCGASGDVIDFVRRLRNLTFREAVDQLQHTAATPTTNHPGLPRRVDTGLTEEPSSAIGVRRAHQVNAVAWQYFSRPLAAEFAGHFLRHHRGIDLRSLRAEFPGLALVGSAGHAWTGLVDHLRRHGVEDDEMVVMDLARRTNRGSLIDALRDRIIIPVTDPAGRIDGFIGRDTSADPRAPKYRNPTRTATFDKSRALYRPTHHRITADGSLVVVEGALDALAIAAAAARTGRTSTVATCTTSGVAVSHAQARAVAHQHPGPIILALDGDRAGAEGTLRWLTALALEQHRTASITRLPHELDPADWLAQHGDIGLDAFCHTDARSDPPVAPRQAGRELVQLSLARARDPVQDTIGLLLPLAEQLPPASSAALLKQAEDEMTRSGWNPHGAFSRRLRDEALLHLRRGVAALPENRMTAHSIPEPAHPALPATPTLSRP